MVITEFGMVMDNRLNNVMKYMTAATILLAAPTLIASVYGMNIELPMQHNVHAFAVITAISLLLALSIVGLLFYLYKKRVF